MRRILCIFFSLFAATHLAHASIITLQFEGEVSANGKPFNGTGLFKFRITDTVGRMLWAHKMKASKGSGYQDVGHLELEVVDGRYSVTLADANEGMPQLSHEYLRRISDPHLEVWFSDGDSEFKQVGVYRVALDPQFDLPVDPLILRRLLVKERKENHLLKQKLRVAQLNRQRLEARSPSIAPKKPKGTRRQTFKVRMNTRRPEVMGSPSAPVVMMEFTDLQCPVCKAFHDDPFKQIKASYIDSGQVLYINAHLPLPIHPDAARSAQAVSCAGEQGQFWSMRDLLFSNQHDLSSDAIETYVNDLGLDWDLFDDCQKQPEIVLEINKQLQFARSVGIKATPTFVIGTIRNGELEGDVIVGAYSFDYFAEKIEALLETAGEDLEDASE